MSGAYGTIKGYIFRQPERKTAKSGSGYAMASVKVRDGEKTIFWRVLAFKDAADALMNFRDGDYVRAEGGVKVETYEKDGATRIAFSLLANKVEAADAPNMQAREQGAAGSYRRPLAAQAANGGPSHMPTRSRGDLNDDIPF